MSRFTVINAEAEYAYVVVEMVALHSVALLC